MAEAEAVKGREKTLSDYITVTIAALSVAIAIMSLVFSLRRETSVDLRNSTRDWQKGLIFSILLSATKPMSIDDIESKYKTAAISFKETYKLTDKNLSREEIYSILLDMISNQSVKLRDANSFSLRTDDDATLDRRAAFDMLRFALSHEFEFPYDNFASQFANWYSREKNAIVTKEQALAILSVAMQSNIVGMAVKPGTLIHCLGQIPPLYVASYFSARSHAPALLAMPGTLPPCPDSEVK